MRSVPATRGVSAAPFLLALLFGLNLAACSCGVPESTLDASSPPPSKDEFDYTPCVVENELPRADLIDAVGRASWTSTPQTLALSPGACWTLVGSGTGTGQLSYSVHHRLFDLSVGLLNREVIRFERLDGQTTIHIDSDQDGVFDIEQVLSPGHSERTTLVDGGPGLATAYTETDGGVLFTQSVYESSGWRTVARGMLAEPESEACAPRPASAGPCSSAEEAEIRGTVDSAIERGFECLSRYSEKRAVEFLTFWLRNKTSDLNVRCGDPRTYIAATYTPWTNTLRWNLDYCDTGGELVGVAFHETIHAAFATMHIADLTDLYIDGKISAEALSAADDTYACSSLCFGWPAPATRCSCAACIRGGSPSAVNMGGRMRVVDRVDEKEGCASRLPNGKPSPCASLPSCVRRDGTGHAYASEAVGALCRSGQSSAASWHETMASCTAACATSCRSFSVSCDKSCQ